MTQASQARASSGSTAAAAVIVLAVIALLAIIVGIMYFAEPAKSLPSILGSISHPASRAAAHRSTRGIVALVVGVVCLIAAWFANRARTASRA